MNIQLAFQGQTFRAGRFRFLALCLGNKRQSTANATGIFGPYPEGMYENIIYFIGMLARLPLPHASILFAAPYGAVGGGGEVE